MNTLKPFPQEELDLSLSPINKTFRSFWLKWKTHDMKYTKRFAESIVIYCNESGNFN